jgi:hypothetical protein
VTGEVANANDRLQWNFNNVVEGADGYTSDGTSIYASTAIDTTSATPALTMSPLPKQLTGPCVAGVCPTADLPAAEILIVSGNYDGQVQLQGHLQMNTEYTVTVKQGTVVKDFYGATYTVMDADMVIKWKTQPAITMTGIGVRNTGQAFTITDKGTLEKDIPANTTDVRFSFNASIDPTTFDLADFKIEPAVPGLTITPDTIADDGESGITPFGCGFYEDTDTDLAGAHNATGWIPSCIMRARGQFREGQYKITFLKDAKVKDIFGIEYTHPADTTITVDIEEPAAIGQCL